MPPPDRNHEILLSEGAAHTRRHREYGARAAGADTAGLAAASEGTATFSDGAIGGSFKRESIVKLLSQPGCKYLRIYYGRDAQGQPSLVLVAADEDMADLTVGAMMENHFPCPPWCPPPGTSALRQDLP